MILVHGGVAGSSPHTLASTLSANQATQEGAICERTDKRVTVQSVSTTTPSRIMQAHAKHVCGDVCLPHK